MKRIVLRIVYKVLSKWQKVAMKNELADQVEQCQNLMQKLSEIEEVR